MLDASIFYDALNEYGFNISTGVPCTFLKSFINCSIDRGQYIAAANEGDAIAIASGAYLGKQKAMVLMQNSGLGNAVSPLTSLNKIYGIPVLMFISHRGSREIKDAPQHEFMGAITTDLLDLMKIKWEYLSEEPAKAFEQLERANACYNSGCSFALVVAKNTFSDYELKVPELLSKQVQPQIKNGSAETGFSSRAEAIKNLIRIIDGDVKLISSTGYISRELYNIKDRPGNFYMMGSLGCVSSIALGFSMTDTNSKTIVLDGDGSVLMRMGALATNAYYGNSGILHILFDNHCHLSTGAQATVSTNMNFPGLAKVCGYPIVLKAGNLAEFEDFINEWLSEPKLTFLYLKVEKSTLGNLMRPQISPKEITKRFMSHD